MGGCTHDSGSQGAPQGLIATKGAAEFGVAYAQVRPRGAEIAELFDAERKSIAMLKFANTDARTTKVTYLPHEGQLLQATIERASDDPRELVIVPLGSLVTALLAEEGLRPALEARGIHVAVATEEKKGSLEPNRWTQACGPTDTGIMLQSQCNLWSCNYTSNSNMYLGSMSFSGTNITSDMCSTANPSKLCWGWTSAGYLTVNGVGSCICSGGSAYGSDFNMQYGCAPIPTADDPCYAAGRLDSGVSWFSTRRYCSPNGTCVLTDLASPQCVTCSDTWQPCGQRCPFDGNNPTASVQRRPGAPLICENVTMPLEAVTNLACTTTTNYNAKAGSSVNTPQTETKCRVNTTPTGSAACVAGACQYVPWPTVQTTWCGDGNCDANEDSYNCPIDCNSCGNGLCENGETCLTCSQDCGFCSGF